MLVLDHLSQLRLGSNAVPYHAAADSAHDVALHRVALAVRFEQQQSVHESPDLAVPPQTLHAHARGVAQHVLHPLRFADWQKSLLIHIPHAHRKTQGKRFGKTPSCPKGCRVIGNARPAYLGRSQGLGKVASLSIYVLALGRRLHATTRQGA